MNNNKTVTKSFNNFSCDICEKTFNYRSYLIKHDRIQELNHLDVIRNLKRYIID